MNIIKRFFCGEGKPARATDISENNMRVDWLEGMTVKITFTDNVYMRDGDTLSIVCPMNIDVILGVVYPRVNE